ncbi:alpha/beta fold hydrolase [Amycolatopsis suaedae]|uniref:alpha/beta fold hydrolase n=1 Tax=Amycolatopsis suaedae TaxID=2510978 RepID=UPI0013EF2A32|nr:alpha/beta fold hydrolase [Amycolatopsis suaedae]
MTWEPCRRDDVADGVECGRITVPVNWSRPHGETTTVRVYRRKAVGHTTAGTIASLPSGPGNTGDISLTGLPAVAPEFDLISLDPRGVGESGPLTCDVQGFILPPRIPPTSQAGLHQLKADQKLSRAACATAPADLLDHLSATDTARDLDYLREALGLDQINIYGFSYGTLIAHRYLARFGQHVRASVLEGTMDPAADRRQFVTAAAATGEAVFETFTRWCASTSSCALHGQDPVEVLRRAQANADSGRIPGDYFGNKWDSASVVGAFETTAGQNRMHQVAQQLNELAHGRNPFGTSGDTTTGPAAPQTFKFADPIVCQDFDLAIRTVDDAVGDLAAARRVAPTVGYNTNASVYTSSCVGWPGPAPGSGGPAASRSAHPTLLVSNTLDIATPLAWAQSVQRQLGDRATLLVIDKIGHGGALSTPGHDRDAIVDYLRTLRTPATPPYRTTTQPHATTKTDKTSVTAAPATTGEPGLTADAEVVAAGQHRSLAATGFAPASLIALGLGLLVLGVSLVLMPRIAPRGRE